mmetsp:Transcript_5479/g.6403  ORF Transcript_5479/g.6403 Transcript_5479/m.6403 type:complete len:386 (-) Transcript_5479:7-1164(-)
MIFTMIRLILLVAGFSSSIIVISSTSEAFATGNVAGCTHRYHSNIIIKQRSPIKKRRSNQNFINSNNPHLRHVHPSILCTSTTRLCEGVRIRDWKEGDGKYIMDLLLSAESSFNPEGPLEIDCGSEESIKESYSEDGACMLVATTTTDDGKSDRIIGTAALIVGTSVTYLKSGASLSSGTITGAIRRVCAVANDGIDTEDSILQSLILKIESRAAEAGVGDLIALAYPATTYHRPKVALLEKMGYSKLPENMDGVDVVQYCKSMDRDVVVESNTEGSLGRSTNGEIQDVAVAASFLTVLFLALIGISSFMGLELIPSSDNRGIGSPLSVQELELLRQDEKLQRTDLDGGQTTNPGGRQWKDLSFEERQEEGALMKIIQGQDARLK